MTKQTNNIQGVVKDRKPKRLAFKNKIIAGILALGLAFGLGATLTACGPDEPTPPPVTISNVTQLVQEYDEQTDKFLNNEVLEDAVKYSTGTYDEEKLLDATYDLGDGNSKTLNSVKVIFTYKDGDDRLYNVNEMKFDTSIDLGKIANYDQNQTELAQIADDATISNQYTTTYNVNESVQNDKLAEAIYKNVVKSNETATHLTLKNNGEIYFALGGSTKVSLCNQYELVAQTNSSVKSYDLVIKQQDSIEDMISSLSNPNNYKLRETRDIENIETSVVYKEYEKENVDVPPPVEEIDNIGELLKDHATETYAFLNKQTEKAVEKIVGEYNKQNVKAVRYDIGDNSKEELDNVKVEIVVADPSVEGKETYYRATVNFVSPVDLNEIAENGENTVAEVEDANIEDTFDYNAKEMYFRQGIVDALMEIAGVNENDGHVMVDFGADNAGETTFTMLVSSDAGVTEYDVTVPTGANEAETIQNIKDAGIMDNEYSVIQFNNAYTEQEYKEQEYTIENIEEALEYYSDQINANLQPVYEAVLDRANAKAENVTDYRWDLGEVVDGNIQNIKLAFNQSVGNDSVYTIYTVKLPNAVAVGDLLKSDTFKDISIPRSNITRDYMYGYDLATQGDKDDFIKAVVNKFDPDFNLESEDVKLIYTDNGSTLDDDYGTCRNFKIVAISNEGVRQYSIITPNIQDSELIDYISRDAFKLNGKVELDFFDNQINVEVENEAEQANYDEYDL